MDVFPAQCLTCSSYKMPLERKYSLVPVSGRDCTSASAQSFRSKATGTEDVENVRLGLVDTGDVSSTGSLNIGLACS